MLELILLVVAAVVVFAVRRNSGRIAALEKEVLKLSEQLATLRSPAATATVAVAAAPSQTEASVAAPTAASSPVQEIQTAAEMPTDEPEQAREAIAETVLDQPASTSVHETAPVVAPVETPSRPVESLEDYLGARWAVWAGGLALALGGLFLVRYSIESGLLGPGVRLALGALFGLALVGVGEALRRNMLPARLTLYSNAMIPGVLTAAGVISVFGAIYAAHGIYEFIGATPAFLLLALTAFATLGLSLLHGQGLAGIGLVGSMVTPLLVSSTSPSPWTLFGFLTLSLVATMAASRRQDWRVVPMLANLCMGGWVLLYVLASLSGELAPAVLALLAMLATAAFLWPGKLLETKPTETEFSELGLAMLLGRSPAGITASLGVATVLPALAMAGDVVTVDVNPLYATAALLATLAAIGASRHSMVWPAILAAIGAVITACVQVQLVDSLVSLVGSSMDSAVLVARVETHTIGILLGLGVFFVAAAFAFLARKAADDPVFATLWAILAATVPLTIGIISYIGQGDYVRDWPHGLYALGVGIALLASAEFLVRAGHRHRLSLTIDVLVAGSFMAIVFGLEALTSGLTMTLLLSVTGFAYVAATRLRDWRALPWMMVAASIGVLARIAWEPTIVGPLSLGKTPVFNALLAGYGIPAMLAIVAAYELRHWPSVRVRSVLQALASVMGLLTVAILLRHAMNGGVLDDSVPTLGEQSIYTLLVVGFSGVLMSLDLRSPSPVFRYGAMIAGVISMANVLLLHLGGLNPFFSGENTGPWPLLNLLLLGYLLPAAAYAGLALYARGKRPAPYVTLLALTGAVLGFAWATLSVRRFWQGENIASWKGFLQSETYSYSVVWLAIGVGLLALGSRFDARSIRLASAALVMLSVAKAFIIDMSNLEGVLRALSFIGLGVVLIGIGLFYQRILTRGSAKAMSTPDEST